MKFLICFVLFLAAVTAHVVGPVTTYNAAVAPAYTSLEIAGGPAFTTYSAIAPSYTSYTNAAPAYTHSLYTAHASYVAAPAVYNAAPVAYDHPATVYSTLLKKK